MDLRPYGLHQTELVRLGWSVSLISGGSVDAISNLASEQLIRSEERQRISRELHNSTAQLLIALQFQVGQLRNHSDIGAAKQLLDEIDVTLQDIHETIKQIGMQLRTGDDALEERQIQTAKVFFSISQLD